MQLPIPTDAHQRRQLYFIRAFAVFMLAWGILDLTTDWEYAHLTMVTAALIGLAFFFPHQLVERDRIIAPRFVWAIGPVISLFTVELLNNTDPFTSLNIGQILLNLIWYYMLFALLQLLFGRIRRSAAISAIIFFAIGVANHYVLTFRGRIIFPNDLVAVRTAMNVADGFSYAPDATMFRAALCLAAYLLLLWRLPAQPSAVRPPRRKALILTAVSAVYCFAFFFTGLLPAINVHAQQWKTQANGFVLNFTAALRYSIVTEPKGYSSDAVQQIADELPPPPQPEMQLPVHIVGIMNESFADLADYDTLSLSEDPMPFLHSMKENTIRGTMYSPVTGGGTANVEFEFLTGNPLAFLPSSTVAYQLYLEDHTPSLVSQLEPLGYSTTAFHPYKSSGWNRPLVYKWMGFDQQLFDEDVPNPKMCRNFISDHSDYKTVMDLTDAAGDNPYFIFNVTMQNHSGYDLPWNGLDRTSSLSGPLEGNYPSVDQFFSLMRASDDALRELIEHYEQSDVPTLVIFFGDHQPPLGNEFYSELSGKPLDDRTTEEIFNQYGTPFFIWANYDIPEAKDLRLSTWVLHLLAAKAAGLELTGYQQMIAQVAEKIPVITPVGYITADGRYSSDEGENLTEEEKALVHEFRLLSYDNIFGGNERCDSLFFPNQQVALEGTAPEAH